jgi:hypothetical protein
MALENSYVRIKDHFYKFETLFVNNTNKRKNAFINIKWIQSFHGIN